MDQLSVTTARYNVNSNHPTDLDQAVRAFDRGAVAPRVAAAIERAEQIRAEFPLDEWPSMALERYALGHAGSKSSFCRRLEFASPELDGVFLGGVRTL
jgi:5-methylcytosine-specific restriction protein B